MFEFLKPKTKRAPEDLGEGIAQVLMGMFQKSFHNSLARHDPERKRMASLARCEARGFCEMTTTVGRPSTGLLQKARHSDGACLARRGCKVIDGQPRGQKQRERQQSL